LITPEPIAAYPPSQLIDTGIPTKWALGLARAADLFGDVKRAILRAPSNLIITIDRIKSIISKPIELLWVMKDVAPGNGWVVADIGAELDDSKFVSSDAPYQLILVDLARQDVLA
jgi:hypothetical protein